jgi:endonuclease G
MQLQVKIFLSGLLIIITCSVFSQSKLKADTILDAGIYRSYFSLRLKEPLYVVYKLYKGGGDCDREKFQFKNDTKLKMATKKNYSGDPSSHTRAVYDIGHLANAEDFAANCNLDELTFRFYNCLPQTGNLNRGIWKTWESRIRNISASDSLLIICGGQFTEGKILGITAEQKRDSIAVPDHCWKIVISLTDHQIKHILYFTNEIKNNSVTEISSLNELEEKLRYHVIF